MYTPDNWVVLFINGKTPHYRVLAGWSGGYTTGDSWRMNSGITSVSETDTSYLFKGSSGSIYNCRKSAYGLRMNNSHVVSQYEKEYPGIVTVMPEDTNWLEMDWIINA